MCVTSTHRFGCTHTRPPPAGHGVCKPPSSGCAEPSAHTPLLWESRVPPAPCHPGAPPPPATPRRWPCTPGCTFQGYLHGGCGRAGGGCWEHPRGGGWHYQAPAEPTGPCQTGSHQPWWLLLSLQGFSPCYKCLCFFHNSFQAGSFYFKNIVVIFWLLLNPAHSPPSSFMGSLGANVSLTVWVTLFALASLS